DGQTKRADGSSARSLVLFAAGWRRSPPASVADGLGLPAADGAGVAVDLEVVLHAIVADFALILQAAVVDVGLKIPDVGLGGAGDLGQGQRLGLGRRQLAAGGRGLGPGLRVIVIGDDLTGEGVHLIVVFLIAV